MIQRMLLIASLAGAVVFLATSNTAAEPVGDAVAVPTSGNAAAPAETSFDYGNNAISMWVWITVGITAFVSALILVSLESRQRLPGRRPLAESDLEGQEVTLSATG